MYRSVSFVQTVSLLFVTLVLVTTPAASATDRVCKDGCQGCYSAAPCTGKYEGSSCWGDGKCTPVKVCTLSACCGCKKGSYLYLDENERIAEGDLPATDASDELPVASVRFFTDIVGSGEVNCGDCTTSAGCKEVWTDAATPAVCAAVPDAGQRFVFWSLDGGFLSDEATVELSEKGTVLEAHFVPVAESPEERSATRRHSLLRPIVFRVYDPEGSPVHQAEVRLSTKTDPIQIDPKCRRGSTVNGLWQSYVPCSTAFPNPHWPSQILYQWEVWTAAGKTAKGYWWQSTNSWTCDQSKDITVRLEPVD